MGLDHLLYGQVVEAFVHSTQVETSSYRLFTTQFALSNFESLVISQIDNKL